MADTQCFHHEIGLQVDRCELEGTFAVTGHVQLVAAGHTNVFPVRAAACEEHLGAVFRRLHLTHNMGMVEKLEESVKE